MVSIFFCDFHLIPEEMIQFDQYFSNGLKPPVWRLLLLLAIAYSAYCFMSGRFQEQTERTACTILQLNVAAHSWSSKKTQKPHMCIGKHPASDFQQTVDIEVEQVPFPLFDLFLKIYFTFEHVTLFHTPASQNCGCALLSLHWYSCITIS